MKIKDKIQSGRLDTYIGEQTSFDGNLTSKDNLSIYGSVRGTIDCQGRVVIGDSGHVEADILANEVVVSGKVLGNVTAKSRLEMVSTGVIKGASATFVFALAADFASDSISQWPSNLLPYQK